MPTYIYIYIFIYIHGFLTRLYAGTPGRVTGKNCWLVVVVVGTKLLFCDPAIVIVVEPLICDVVVLLVELLDEDAVVALAEVFCTLVVEFVP